MKTTANYGLKKPEGTDVVNIDDFNENADKIDLEIKSLNDNKQDKVTGKGLSTNDYTTAEKNKLAGIATGANNYVHPSTHPASIIAQDANNRFVTDTEKTTWNAKETTSGAQTKANTAESNAKAYTDTKIAGVNTELAQMAKDYVRSPAYGKTSGTATAYTLTLNPIPTTYVDGMGVTIVPHVDCGANPTLNINGLGATPLLKADGISFTQGELKIDKPYSFVRVGNNFFIRSGAGSIIKNKQNGEVVLKTTTLTIPISAVDLSKSIINLSVVANSYNSDSLTHGVTAEFISSSEIKLSRYRTNSDVNIYWEVITFNDIKSLQKGTINSVENNNPAPAVYIDISPVDTRNILLFYNFRNTSYGYSGTCKMFASSATKLKLETLGGALAVNWQLVEFN